MSDIEFIDGLIIKEPRQGAPDFVKASLSIKREELITWLQGRDDAWVNADIKVSRAGKWFCAVNDWKPAEGGRERSQQSAPPKGRFEDDSDLPF